VTTCDATSGATTYYTTHGTTLTAGSTQNTAPITVGSTETLKAIATVSSYSTSSVAGAAYSIFSPIVSLSPASLAFGNEPIGITGSAQTVTMSKTGENGLFHAVHKFHT